MNMRLLLLLIGVSFILFGCAGQTAPEETAEPEETIEEPAAAPEEMEETKPPEEMEETKPPEEMEETNESKAGNESIDEEENDSMTKEEYEAAKKKASEKLSRLFNVDLLD